MSAQTQQWKYTGKTAPKMQLLCTPKMQKKLQALMDQIQSTIGGAEFDYDDRYFSVHLIWGDWKHSHAYLNDLVTAQGGVLIGTYPTEENGSDCYSGVHKYYFTR